MQNKKYKHKILNLFTKNDVSDFYTLWEDNNIYKGSVYKDIVENSSDWKEVKEEQYKILSLNWLDNIYNISNETINGEVKYVQNLGYLLLSTCFNYLQVVTINSILRIEDNEIFRVGGSTIQGVITQIVRYDNGIRVHTLNSVLELGDVQKAKTPIIVSMDEVKLFDGDMCYFVNKITYTWSSYKLSSIKELKLEDYLCFSTKEAANNWILYNKPCISINDIREIQKNKYLTSTDFTCHIGIEKLVKERLKL